MAIFQNSVIRNQVQDESLIASRWAKYQNFLAKVDAIKSFKEEIYQDGFLHDIFENCLGYTLKTTNPSQFNLDREQKNETDGKKADGSMMLDGKIIGVIELKDQKSKNLDAIEAQAFGYHTSHSHNRYIIISNFDELRFYIDKKTTYEKFYLFSLTYDEFKKLHLILSFESISSGLTLKLKELSSSFEQTISKKLYNDFSIFRTHMFENIVKNNYVSVDETSAVIPAEAGIQSVDPRVTHEDDRLLDKQTLLRLTQKLCDRIVFILFAEDRGLLKPNTIMAIREHFHNQAFTNFSLYDIYKFYFDGINIGNDKLGIPRYNGGLFAKDEMLDSLVIDDECLDMEAQQLSDYDFESDISVNILGHIFEQSLTDLEEMERSFEVPRHSELVSESNETLKRVQGDKKISKRKKDGVFYTPEYITHYIVENTLGKLCSDKKAELGIEDIQAPKDSRKPTKKEQITKENLEIYRNWLLVLKILDPACGSGAFLNQALEFLIREHKSLQQNLVIMGDITAFYDIEESILEHNLYGVDINEDAVEIAKLSLWLRTAQKGRMLTNLSDKIVCANSLLDMPFCRHSELDSESTNQSIGCFDVVIGNPPYVRQEMINNEIKEKYISKYTHVATSTADLYVYFYELSIKLLKKEGLLGFITPNKWMERKYGFNLRKYLKSFSIHQLINFGELNVFDDASTEPVIIILENQMNDNDIAYAMIKSIEEAQSSEYQTLFYKKSELSDEIWRFTNPLTTSILTKFKNADTTLKKYTDKGVFYGLKTGLNKAFIINENTYQEIISKDKNSNQLLKKMVEGDDFGKWELKHSGRYIVATGYDLDIRESYPAVFEYLEQFRDELIKRQDKGVNYWNLRACDYYDKLEEPKLIYYHTALNHKFYYDTDGYYISANCYFIANADKYLQSILNSKLFSFVKKYLFPAFGDAEKGGRIRLDANKMNTLPIKNISQTEQQPFVALVDEIMEAKEKIKKYRKHFDTLNAVDKIEIAEEIEKLELRVTECEHEIDNMVYKLYDLSEDEIRLVEGTR